MTIVDFSMYRGLYDCPIWWQNFVRHNTSVEEDGLEHLLLTEHNVVMNTSDDLDSLVFESDQIRNEFILFWTLYGK